MIGSWFEQWSRVQRYFTLFTEINNATTSDRTADDLQDDVYAFFQNSHHLKDWLKNDPATSSTCADVEQLINNSLNLGLGADLCNATKHLSLKHHIRVDPNTGVTRRRYRMNLLASLGINRTPAAPPAPQLGAEYEITAGGKTYDAYKVATACMAEWETYLRSKSLL